MGNSRGQKAPAITEGILATPSKVTTEKAASELKGPPLNHETSTFQLLQKPSTRRHRSSRDSLVLAPGPAASATTFLLS